MEKKNVLETNYGSYLTYRDVLHWAKDSVMHYGLGEKLRFDLFVYYKTKKDRESFNYMVYKDLPYKDPWYKNHNTLLEILTSIHEELPKAHYRLFASLYKED